MTIIKFFTNEKQIFDLYPPKPMDQELPKWVNDDSSENSPIKKCLPVMDYVNSGYVVYSNHNYFVDEEVKKFQKGITVKTTNLQVENLKRLAIVSSKGLPHIKRPFFKILTNIRIQTPIGYSCIITQPFYHFNSDFTVFPGIVDTDKFDYYLELVCSSDKKNLYIPGGIPIAQIFPFKRENWKMEKIVNQKPSPSKMFHFLENCYKNFFWSKKSFK